MSDESNTGAGDALDAKAAALDAEAAVAEKGPAAPAAPGAPGAPAPIDRQAEATDLVNFATTLLFPLWPSLEKVYTPDVRARLASSAVPLMVKYDFSLAEFFKQWAPEIGFAMVALPLVNPTIEAVKADRAKRKAAEAAKKADASAPAAAPAPPGAAIAADMLERAQASPVPAPASSR